MKKKKDIYTTRSSEATSMGDVLKLFSQQSHIKKNLVKVDARQKWLELMGPGVASYTHEVKLQGSTLIIRLTSSALREELNFGKEKIKAIMNEGLGEEVIKKVILS